MKEKLKKIFTCKDLWNFIFEIICGIILLCCGYFSGFANGLLIEDDIRDNMIVEINDLIDENHKNEKLEIVVDKKNAIQLPYNSTISFDTFISFDQFYDANYEEYHLIYLGYELDFNYTINSSNIVTITDIYIDSFGWFDYVYTGSNSVLDEVVPIFYDDTNYSLNYFDSDEYFSFSFNDVVKFSEIKLDYQNDTFLLEFFINLNSYISTFSTDFATSLFNSANTVGFYMFSFDKNVSFDDQYMFFLKIWYEPNPLVVIDKYTYLSNALNVFLTEIYGDYQFNLGTSQGGASREELEQAYQEGINVGYQSGVIEGKSEFINSQEYRDILKEEYDKGKDDGFDIGYQARQDSVEDSEQTINSIWSILEKAITSVLNVLSFEIMPGIPLYICIVVPILLCILLWVIKVGAS